MERGWACPYKVFTKNTSVERTNEGGVLVPFLHCASRFLHLFFNGVLSTENHEKVHAQHDINKQIFFVNICQWYVGRLYHVRYNGTQSINQSIPEPARGESTRTSVPFHFMVVML